MNNQFKIFSDVWKHVLVDVFHWPDNRFSDVENRYRKHAAEDVFYSGGPLQYVVFEVLPPEIKQSGDSLLVQKLAWELQEVLQPHGKDCTQQDFDWLAAKDRIQKYFLEKGWPIQNEPT